MNRPFSCQFRCHFLGGAEGLAERMNFKERTTEVLLEALVELDYLTQKEDVYSLPEEIEAPQGIIKKVRPKGFTFFIKF